MTGSTDQITTIYQAVNKVFCTTFWTEEEAQKFVNSTSPSAGFRISPLQIFGNRTAWIEKIQNESKEK